MLLNIPFKQKLCHNLCDTNQNAFKSQYESFATLFDLGMTKRFSSHIHMPLVHFHKCIKIFHVCNLLAWVPKMFKLHLTIQEFALREFDS